MCVEFIHNILFARFFYNENQIPKLLGLNDHFVRFFGNDVEVKNLKIGTVVMCKQFQSIFAKFGTVIFDAFNKRRFRKYESIKYFQLQRGKIFEELKIGVTISIDNICGEFLAEESLVVDIVFLHIHHVAVQVFETQEDADFIQSFKKSKVIMGFIMIITFEKTLQSDVRNAGSQLEFALILQLFTVRKVFFNDFRKDDIMTPFPRMRIA